MLPITIHAARVRIALVGNGEAARRRLAVLDCAGRSASMSMPMHRSRTSPPRRVIDSAGTCLLAKNLPAPNWCSSPRSASLARRSYGAPPTALASC